MAMTTATPMKMYLNRLLCSEKIIEHFYITAKIAQAERNTKWKVENVRQTCMCALNPHPQPFSMPKRELAQAIPRRKKEEK
jgi:hypothetical protein